MCWEREFGTIRGVTTEAIPADALTRPQQPWVMAGVASEIAYRLRAPVGFIRTVIVLAAWARFWPVLGAYSAAALLIPHAGRRLPGWSNAAGLLRIAVFVAFAVGLMGSLSLDRYGMFGQGPEAWVTVGGVLVIGWIMVLTSRRDPASATVGADRRYVVSALPAVALAGIVAAAVAVVPGLRSEQVLDLGLVAIGVGIVLGGSRISAAAAAMPAALLAAFAIVLAFAGVPLKGGIGRTYAAPRTPSALSAAYRRAIGSVTLDLGRFQNARGAPAHVDLSVGIGNVQIVLPPNTTSVIDARVGRGGINSTITPPVSSQFFVHRVILANTSHEYPGPTRASGLTITAYVGRGCVIVTGPGGEAAGC